MRTARRGIQASRRSLALRRRRAGQGEAVRHARDALRGEVVHLHAVAAVLQTESAALGSSLFVHQVVNLLVVNLDERDVHLGSLLFVRALEDGIQRARHDARLVALGLAHHGVRLARVCDTVRKEQRRPAFEERVDEGRRRVVVDGLLRRLAVKDLCEEVVAGLAVGVAAGPLKRHGADGVLVHGLDDVARLAAVERAEAAVDAERVVGDFGRRVDAPPRRRRRHGRVLEHRAQHLDGDGPAVVVE
mmetsp:Transcript_5782/g.18347  ORF Transcript_5782/g.18347 Transcript_5782/m.18347 type:complete len:246 (+) Transcript_5782:2267-3004(+)